MKIAAYQAPLLAAGSMEALDLIKAQVRQCEIEDVSILCCPEAILGGLADDDPDPHRFAIEACQLGSVLAPLASDSVSIIIGFTEVAGDGRLYNSAAVFHRGSVAGVYRKRHPAIRRSVYEPGTETPTFRIGELRFGIVICNDSNYPELARGMAANGATVLFVPTNCGLPPSKGGAELVALARKVDIATAITNRMWVVRADVVGHSGELVSYGSSGIVNPDGLSVDSASISMITVSIQER